ncbi:HlyD family efflux transporter periplasmic adaptor subunit [Aggregatimonas sangjinii]|uniref:HlyD family efflux transporter periplasmic adaptor subunit n=1 Tax=Aggregatimonas sangjinii TaxID=2583587 RepID=A0A5B7SZ44_9FLAO|nr:HlyD family efflux transporter periplasmic adaptor subunit [Aggregatimonas sangjinii]QCX02211.1 HlyD family efflux transporter periplasmic adaptor subunit [Aggregatimonas sangjinii]
MPDKVKIIKLKLRSEEVQEILTTPPSWIVRWGMALIFILTIILILLSFLINYPDFVTAKILVTTKEPTEKIVARYSGSIDKFFVENRDSVQIGQAIAVLKNSAIDTDVYRLKELLDSIGYNIRDFIFPLEVTSKLRLGEIEPSYIEFEKNYIEYSLLKNLKPYENQLSGNRNSLTELKSQMTNQIAQKKILEDEIILRQNEFERHERLFKKGVISNQEYEQKQLDILQTQKSINAMAISISQMREAISGANQSIRTTFINKNKDNTTFLKNLLQAYNTLNRAIGEWEYKYVLSSSINGKISFHEFWGTNQQVNTGDVVFSILPLDKNELVGKLVIPSQNAGKVILGQKVLVKLDNFPYQQYGMLIGEVKNISASPNSEGNYFVYIALSNGTKTSYNKTLPFDQELIGNAEIITENLSIAQRILYKFKDVFKY